MTKEDIKRKFNTDFTQIELNRIGSKPQATIKDISKADKIIVENELVDYLEAFFEEYFTGEPVPKVFSNALIEWKRKGEMLRLYVTFPEDRPEYVYIDIFNGWDFYGKVFYLNVSQDEIDQSNVNGSNNYFSCMVNVKADNPKYNKDIIYNIGKHVPIIFAMVYWYVEANKGEKCIYKEDTVYSEEKSTDARSEKTKYRKGKNPTKRDKVFVPRKRRIYTVKETEITEKNLREYIYSRWKVRGYSYTRKDGKVINVKEHYKNRHLPNQGIEKEGKDYILRKRDEDV